MVPIRTVTLAERPDLIEPAAGVLAENWPLFMLYGQPGHGASVEELLLGFPRHQTLLLEDSTLVGVGLSVPLPARTDDLPAGWDAAVREASQGGEDEATVGTVCALSITVAQAARRRGLSRVLIDGLKQAAADHGANRLVAPVRPTHKAMFPLIPIEQYRDWRTSLGEIFDPWLRTHVGMGGSIRSVAPSSMVITGSLEEWTTWTGIELPGSGSYIIPGGLVPLEVDAEGDTGVYREPNVWVTHQLD